MGRQPAQKPEARAIEAIDRHGVLLVYPVQNRPEPRSLWHALHPGSRMHWAWDDSADERVVELWHLRERLARSRKVVYTKWLGGRATFFSRGLFRAALATIKADYDPTHGLGRASLDLFEILHDDSPQPTRRLREAAGLEGRLNETAFTRAMRPLWERMLIVGTGEMEEGGFPSLAVGATELIHEPLWLDSDVLRGQDTALLTTTMADSRPFARAFKRVVSCLRRREDVEPNESLP